MYGFVAFAVVVAFITSCISALLSSLAYSLPGKLFPEQRVWGFARKAAIASLCIGAAAGGLYIVGPAGLKHLGPGWPCVWIGVIVSTFLTCTLGSSEKAYVPDTQLRSAAPPPAVPTSAPPSKEITRREAPARPARGKRGTMTAGDFEAGSTFARWGKKSSKPSNV